MEYHKIADIFPIMAGNEFDIFKADIKENGLLEPICIFEGKILDGRNRHRACQELNIKPKTVEFKGPDPVKFVISTNLHRRHLNESQRALVAAKIKPMFEAAAKERQVRKPADSVSANLREQEKTKSSSEAAKTVNVSPPIG